jgi:phosphohistidine phosphatase SixA
MVNYVKRHAMFAALIGMTAFVAELGVAIPARADRHDQVMEDSMGTSSLPERILLMRHAEKPDDENIPHLTAAGFERAERLPNYIFSQFGRPDYIFASANSRKSSRPYETAVPLSKQSGVPIDATFRDKDFERLAYVLRHDSRFSGKLIVVVWHHGSIPGFAQALNAQDGAYPLHWDSKVFNQILQFDYTAKSYSTVKCLTEPF